MALALLAELSETLAEVFLEPDADLNGRLGQLLSSGPGPSLYAPLKRMADAVQDTEAQAVEYARLFMHSREADVVHLYGSVQSRGFLMAPEVLGSLKEIYDGADISPQEDLLVPPDHLGLELACLGYLLEQLAEPDLENAERERLRSLARRLLREHLDPLVRAIGTQLPQIHAHAYYLGAAELAQALLRATEAELA
ncbi:MAG TPA: molecular chaperone TorD family protein [Holophagaceae bacterium]